MPAVTRSRRRSQPSQPSSTRLGSVTITEEESSDDEFVADVPYTPRESSSEYGSEEIPPPPGAEPIILPGRNPLLPTIYLISSHSKIKKPHGRLFLGMMDCRKSAMENVFRAAAEMQTPISEGEIVAQGYLVLEPSQDDYFILRDKFGTGEEKDDRVVSWSFLPDKIKHWNHISELRNLRSRLEGPPQLMTSEKAKKINGEYIGGIQFERHDRAICTKKGPRCYQLGATIQTQKTLSAPGLQGKVESVVADDDAKMRSDVLKLGAKSSVMGLQKGPIGLQPALKRQAEVTALPPIGDDENVAWPSWQLNNVAAVPFTSRQSIKTSLGKFGGPHVDPGDNTVPPTAVTVLSEDSPEIEPDYFYILDCGIAWRAEEFATFYFSGLHFHGGSQPRYREDVTQPSKIFNRLTLVAYPPMQMLNGQDAVALAAMPGSKRSESLFKVGLEMRNPRSHQLSQKGHCTQATWAADGGSMLTPRGHLNHYSRLLLQAITYFTQQLPPHLLPRVDKSLAMKIVSVVIDNKRVTADDWALGPGSSGEDVRIGKDYTQLLGELGVTDITELSPTQLALLCNSDALTQVPYNNQELKDALEEWEQLLSHSKKSLPICVTLDGEPDELVLGGRFTIAGRKAALKRALREKEQSRDLPPSKKPRIEKGDGSKKGKNRDLACQSSRDAEGERITGGEDVEMQDAALLLSPAFEGEGGAQVQEEHQDSSSFEMQGHNGGPTEGILEMSTSKCQTLILKAMSLENLARTQSSVERALSNLDHHLPISQEPNFTKLQSILDQSILSSAKEIWPLYRALSTKRSASVINIWMQQKQLLIANMLAWEWLESRLEEAYEYEHEDISNGIAKLIRRLESILVTQAASVDLDASDFLPCFDPKEAVYEIRKVNRRYQLPTKELILRLASSVLEKWLDFPAHLQQQAWFVRELVDGVGEQLLLLEDVWVAAQHVNIHVLGKGRNATVTRKEIQGWSRKVLASHPLADRRSQHYHVLCQIDRDVQVVMAIKPMDCEYATQIFRPQPIAFRNQGNHILSSEAGSASVSDWNRDQTSDRVASPALRLTLPADSPDLLPFTPGAEGNGLQPTAGLDISQRPSFERFCRQIELLFCFLDEPALEIVPPQKKDVDAYTYWTSIYRDHVQVNSDKKLPFRDLATSRRRILGPQGPFSPEYLSTRKGLFSAIMYRGITHNTQFLQDQKLIFSDLEDWQTLYDRLRAAPFQCDERYFCNPSAYGRGRHRATSHAEAYWQFTATKEAVAFIENDRPTDFYSLYKLFQTLPAFGSLTAYLLAADYATAGKATIPSFKDMGRIIGQIGKGGLKGLKLLGWDELNKRNKDDIAVAFEAVYRGLEKRFPFNRRQQMNFNVFFVEHALCKLDRLDVRSFRNIPT